MTLSSPQLRRFIRRALVEETRVAAPNRTQLAAAFDTLCERLRRRLQPLFGTTAVITLFARALHLATSDFPWLATAVPKNGERCSANGIAAIADLTAASAEEGLAAVLAHDIGLLRTFVGDDLVLPLVQQAWGFGPAAGAEDQR